MYGSEFRRTGKDSDHCTTEVPRKSAVANGQTDKTMGRTVPKTSGSPVLKLGERKKERKKERSNLESSRMQRYVLGTKHIITRATTTYPAVLR